MDSQLPFPAGGRLRVADVPRPLAGGTNDCTRLLCWLLVEIFISLQEAAQNRCPELRAAPHLTAVYVQLYWCNVRSESALSVLHLVLPHSPLSHLGHAFPCQVQASHSWYSLHILL